MKPANLALVVAAALAPAAAFPQAYPSKPIRNIATISGGGEVNARVLAEKLGIYLGQPVVVESQAGAGGSQGATTVSRAAPDGYTILYGTTSAMVLRQFIVKDMPYDLFKDFTAVAQLGNATGAIIANIDMPFSNMKGMLEYARKNKVFYGSTGNGTTHHLAGVTISQLTGVPLVHVPYKGAPPAVTDLLGGRIQLALSTMSSFTPLVQAGKAKLIAINEDRRMAQFPDTPTVFEEIPGYDRLASWFGYFAPPGLPAPILKRLATEIERASNQQDVRDKYGAGGSLINYLPPDKFAADLKKQVALAAQAMKGAGIVAK